jgi:hypothetical protein
MSTTGGTAATSPDVGRYPKQLGYRVAGNTLVVDLIDSSYPQRGTHATTAQGEQDREWDREQL